MRRRVALKLIAICCAFGVSAVGGGPAGAASAGDWPQFMYGPRRGGFNPDETILNPATVGGLTRKWVFPTGSSIFGSPAVVGGVAYFPSSDAHIYAVDAATGQQRWGYDTNESLERDSPAISGGVLYQTTYGAYMFAIDAQTGRPRWKVHVGNCESSAAVANGMVFVATWPGKIKALDARTGATLWLASTYPYPGVESSPMVADGIVYVAVNQRIKGYDATTGTLVFQSEAAGVPILGAPVAFGSLIITSTFGDTVYAFDRTSGAIQWTATTSPGAGNSESVALADGVVYVGASDGGLYAFDAATGALRWSARAGEFVFAAPSVAGGVVYAVGSDLDGSNLTLYAFQANSGAPLAALPINGPVYGGPPASSPAVSNGMVFVGSTDSNMYAFGL